MIVTRVHHFGGSRIEPPLDPEWSKLGRLEWLAAVVALETGLVVSVQPQPVGPWFHLKCGGTAYSAMPFTRVWDVLNGISTGATEARRGDNRG